MFALVFTILFIGFIVGITIYFARKPFFTTERKEIKDMSEESLRNVLIEEAKTMRTYENGGIGIRRIVYYSELSKANRMISRKVKENIGLSEAEKWFYENYYLIYRNTFAPSDTMKKLPHVSGEPRIFRIAKTIVMNSLNHLTGERVRNLIGSLKGVVSFSYEEICLFNEAISAAILECLYALALRLNYDEKCRVLAKYGKIYRKWLTKDVYLHAILEKEDLRKQLGDYFEKQGIDSRMVSVSYNRFLLKNTNIAETMFCALSEIESFVPIHLGLKYLGAYHLLSKTVNTEEISVKTLCTYFEIIEKTAAQKKVSEEYVCAKGIELAKKNKTDISFILLDHRRELKRYIAGSDPKLKKERSIKESIYTIGNLTLAILFCVGIGFLTGNVYYPFIVFVPALFLGQDLIDYILSNRNNRNETPSMRYKNVTLENNTMVVVSEFISDFSQLEKCLFHAEVIAEGNRDQNISVALLLDTKGGNTPIGEVDHRIMEYLEQNDLPANVNVFLRKKTYSKGRFIAKERKRGAIMALAKLLTTREDFEFLYIKRKDFITPRYLVTLDADNTLMPGGVLQLVNMMAHPYNRSYDIVTLTGRYNLFSIKNVFSLRYLEDSGFERYPYYTPLYYKLFRKSIFCGKGIIRLESFYNKLEGVLPSEKVLSHDILEGSIVKTGNGTLCFEDVPQNLISEQERRKRWLRGDIMLLPFLFGRWKNDEQMVVTRKFSPLYRYIIGKNFLGAFRSIAFFAAFCVGLFLSYSILYVTLGLFFVPYVFALIKTIRGFAYGKQGGKTIVSMIKILSESIKEFFLIGYYAIADFLLLLGIVVKKILKKNLLEWKTFGSTQKKNGFDQYVRESVNGLVLLTVLCIPVFVFTPKTILVAAYALCYIAVMISLWASEHIALKYNPKTTEDTTLLNLAENTYKYFSFMRNGNGLIADNLQVRPYKGESKTTSPTNIGFSLLAEIGGYYLGILSLSESIFNMEKIVSAVEKLDKWEGNLFNWYSVETMKPDRFFVSSVDNGNLLAALLCAKNFCKQNGEGILEKRIEKIMREMRLDRLYDSDNRLFYIGYDGNAFTGHYDLLASEARILSFLFMAFYKKFDHYYALKKDYTGYCGNILLSWSGTMFEMLMPELFFRSPMFSAVHKSAIGTIKKQRKQTIEGIWGVSESGYAQTDKEQRYQYSAFGLKDLALDGKTKSDTIAPYAGVLAVGFSPIEVIRNIKKLQEMGCGFEYGLYESIDFSEGKKIVYSAMTHHQGMILTALVNYLKENAIGKLFLIDPAVCSVMNYLNEIQPTQRFPKRRRTTGKKVLPEKENYNVTVSSLRSFYHTAALCEGDYRLFCKGIGGGASYAGDIAVNRDFGVYEESDGMFFFASENGTDWKTATVLPYCDERYENYFTYGGKEIIYSASNGTEEYVTLLPEVEGEVRKFKAIKKYRQAAFYFDICLDTSDGYASHPAFKDLFVHIRPIAPNTILVTKRIPGDRDGYRYIWVRVSGLKNMVWECNRMNFLGRTNDLSSADFLMKEDEPVYPSMGDVLSPCVGCKGSFDEMNECQAIILFGTDLTKLTRIGESLPLNAYQYALQAEKHDMISLQTNEILGDLRYASYDKKRLNRAVFGGKDQAFYAFSEGKKIIRYDLDEKAPEKINMLKKIISDLRKIRTEIKLMIYSPDRVSGSVEKNVGDTLSKNVFYDYVFVYGDDQRKDWYFTAYDSGGKRKAQRFAFGKTMQARLSCVKEVKIAVSLPPVTYQTGAGGYDECGRYIVNKKTFLPYSNVIADIKGGAVTTTEGGGFFYFGNSRENKAIRFYNDSAENRQGEYIYVKKGETYRSVFGGSEEDRYVLIDQGSILYKTTDEAFEATVEESIVAEGKLRMIDMDLTKRGNDYLEILYAFYPCLHWKYDDTFITFWQNSDVISVKNLSNGRNLYCRIFGIKKDDISLLGESERLPYFEFSIEKTAGKYRIVFAEDHALLTSVTSQTLDMLKEKSINRFHSIAKIDIASGKKWFDYSIRFLPYQILSSRLLAKAGFYQVGGATGFRDQLQDSLAFFTDPLIMRERIIEACKHQYEEGDVMHWWHEPKFGLRSRITDDRLFLPFLLTKYIEYTGDTLLIEEKVPFLHSSPLSPEEKDRFENPPETEYTESIFQHALRAIRASLKYGKHGLLIMGKGDWNDGMDTVCEKGMGESVFNSMLCCKILIEFSKLCQEDLGKEMIAVATELKKNINTFAYDDDRYLRLFSDDERWLGSAKTKGLSLDLLTQSMAVLTGVADGERAVKCMNSARELIDRDLGIVKLLSPPQNRKDYLGYISDYPSGIRENGGQYTHAAMWYLIALTVMGRQDEAFDLFEMMNPAKKCETERGNRMYMGEPYVIGGDVYSNKNNAGRCGWTWYTGSAAWTYKLITEYFFGLKRRGDELFIEPHLPKKLQGSIVVYKHNDSRYVIEYTAGLVDRITIDGENKNKIKLTDGERKNVKVQIGY